jgi:hypothetical protein
VKPLKKFVVKIRGGGMFPDREVYLATEADARFAELEAERDAARADAERYRWLKTQPQRWMLEYMKRSRPLGRTLDAAIDAARSKE